MMEMETILSQEGSQGRTGVSYSKRNNRLTLGDAEANRTDNFNPFRERRVEKPTTNNETLVHLIKSCLGSGILSMPMAFSKFGMAYGIIGTILVSILCTHCAYILVKCAHVLYFRTRKTKMDFGEVAEEAFATGPVWAQKFSKPIGYLIKFCLFLAYFLSVSAYTITAAGNFQRVYNEESKANDQTQLERTKLIILILLPILVLYCFIRNLKYLAPFSLVANVLMGISLAATFYGLIEMIIKSGANDNSFEWQKWDGVPIFLSTTVFALEAIGVIMPLENNMKSPQNFIGAFGVLNKGMILVTIIYILMGALGYYATAGKAVTSDIITQDLTGNKLVSQGVNAGVGLAVLITFALAFYVCMNIAWNKTLPSLFGKKANLANYTLRTVLVILAVMLGYFKPDISAIIGLVGAFCFSIVGIIIPAIIEIITFWNLGFGKGNWMVVKNILIIIIGFIVLVLGTKVNMEQLLKT